MDEFIASQKTNSKAAETIRRYRHILANLQKRISGELKFAPQEAILAFISEEGKAKATLNTRASTLKTYFAWMLDHGRILKDPMAKIETPKLDKLLPKYVMTRGETMKVLDIYRANEDDPLEFRNRLILELLYTASLRRGELVALNINDFDPVSATLRVHSGKTFRGRLVPIGQTAFEMLNIYLGRVRQDSREKDALFLNRNGTRMKAEMVSHLAKTARRQSKIRTKASAHSFRKSSATHMLKNGAPLVAVQALLGHVRPTTTEAYTKLNNLDIEKMLRVHHPRERQKNLNLSPFKLPEFIYQDKTFDL